MNHWMLRTAGVWNWFFINILMKWKYQRKRLFSAFGTQCFSLFLARRGLQRYECCSRVAASGTHKFFSRAIETHQLLRENNHFLLQAENLFKAANNQLVRAAARGRMPSWVLNRLAGASRRVSALSVACDFCQLNSVQPSP